MDRSREDDFEQGDVFLDEDDIIQQIDLDEEELPEIDEDMESDAEEEHDDSVHLFTGHTGEVYSVACSPSDASLIATGGGDDKGFLWRIADGDWVFDLKGHSDSVSCLAFSADGKFLASGGFDGIIQIWDTTSGSLKCVLDGPGEGIEWLRWHPRGHLLLAGSEDKTAWMWNAEKKCHS